MRLGIDLDGVVADFNAGWMLRYNEERETSLVPEHVDHWDAMVSLTDFETDMDFWKWAENGDGPGLFRHLPVFPDALPSLNRLAVDHDIVIITTKPPWAIHDTYAWLSDNRIPTHEVHITEKKWKIDCDVYLDDGPHNLESLVRERPDRTTVRFVRPWNKPVFGVMDVVDWNEFEALVNQQYC